MGKASQAQGISAKEKSNGSHFAAALLARRLKASMVGSARGPLPVATARRSAPRENLVRQALPPFKAVHQALAMAIASGGLACRAGLGTLACRLGKLLCQLRGSNTRALACSGS